jgi:transcriptional regulator with GAF, ATPase, and Fis domain
VAPTPARLRAVLDDSSWLTEGPCSLTRSATFRWELQPKLLRVIQEGQFERLGGTATIRTDVRAICATHRNLIKMTEERQFRADLFYRLSVFPIELAALGERPEDIRLLVPPFCNQLR